MTKHPQTHPDLVPLLGATEAEAAASVAQAGGLLRVSNRDGKPMVCTRDYRTDRVNLHLEGGKVVAAYFG
jgi:hypothetical protein